MKIHIVSNGEANSSEMSIEAFKDFEKAFKRYTELKNEIGDDEDYFVNIEETDLID